MNQKIKLEENVVITFQNVNEAQRVWNWLRKHGNNHIFNIDKFEDYYKNPEVIPTIFLGFRKVKDNSINEPDYIFCGHTKISSSNSYTFMTLDEYIQEYNPHLKSKEKEMKTGIIVKTKSIEFYNIIKSIFANFDLHFSIHVFGYDYYAENTFICYNLEHKGLTIGNITSNYYFDNISENCYVFDETSSFDEISTVIRQLLDTYLPSLPTINSYAGTYLPDENVIKYGCAKLDVNMLTAIMAMNKHSNNNSNRIIDSIKLDSGIEILYSDIKKCVEYINYHKND